MPDDIPTYGIWSVHEDVREGRIECEPDLKDDVLGAITKVGTTLEGDEWRHDNPLSIILDIIGILQQIIDTRRDLNENELSEEELDYNRRAYVRFYRIRRAVKHIIKQL